MPDIHPDWDQTKALAHLARLHTAADQSGIIAAAFEDAAEEHRRHEESTRSQIAHCEAMFSKPRPKQPGLSDLRTTTQCATREDER